MKSMSYQSLSRISTIYNANGDRQNIEYDAAGQVIGIADEYPGMTGNLSIVSYSGCNFDDAGRIADEFVAPIPSGYTEPTLSMSNEADNRLASFNGLTVTHDADGNMVQGPLGTESLAGYGYDARNRLVSVSKPAVISNPTFSDGTTYHNHVGTTNQSYGPVNVRVGGEHGVAGVAAGSVRDNYDGWVGCQFTVGAVPVTISELGRWVLAGNTGSHVVKTVGNQ